MSRKQTSKTQALDKDFLDKGISTLVKMIEEDAILKLTKKLEDYTDKLLLQIKAALCNNAEVHPKRLVEFINAELEHRTIEENRNNSREARKLSCWALCVSIITTVISLLLFVMD
jgi:hypothetical protein